MRYPRLVLALCAVSALAASSLLVISAQADSTAPTGRATLAPFHITSNDFKVDSKQPSDIVISQFVIAAGRSTGWHTHPGPTYIVVTAGTLTRYQGDDPTCTGHAFSANQGWVEPPGQVHIARNEGTLPVYGMVAYTDVAVGGAFKILAAAPGNCPF